MSRPKLTKLPIYFAVAAIGLSFALAVVIFPKFSTDAMLPYAIVGYVLTPFIAAAALVWARGLDLKLQANPLYFRIDGRRQIRHLGVIVAVSFVPAIFHIWYIAGFVGSSMA